MKKILISSVLVIAVFTSAIAVYAEGSNINQVDVTAEVSPTYSVVIPTSQDFGVLQRNAGITTMNFDVKVEDVLIDDGADISITVTGSGTDGAFVMKDKNGTGSIELPFNIYNDAGAQAPLQPGAVFGNFTENEIKNGRATVNTADIQKAGSYKGTMTFTISYSTS